MAETLGLDFVYVLEVRVSSLHKILKQDVECIENGITGCQDGCNIDEILGDEVDRNVHLRLLGGNGLPCEVQQNQQDYKFDANVHVLALNSSYGIQYDAPDEKISYRAGIFMPLHKSNKKVLVAKKKQKATDVNKNKQIDEKQNEGEWPLANEGSARRKKWINLKDEEHEKDEGFLFRRFAGIQAGEVVQERVKVVNRYGGFVMAGFSVIHRLFSPVDVEYMKLCVKALDNVFQ